jgi:dolichol-phosphate mannosyltransferase
LPASRQAPQAHVPAKWTCRAFTPVFAGYRFADKNMRRSKARLARRCRIRRKAAMTDMTLRQDRPAVAVVVPVRNEADNLAPLIDEIAAALTERWAFEVIYVDDGSTDATAATLAQLRLQHPWLRQIRHAASCGQSAAVRSGVAVARAPLIVTLDGDGQNDPAFLPPLIEALETGWPQVGLIAGQRVGRQDTGFKRLQSRIANAVRGAVLKDGTRDTGCGLKAFPRDVFLELPYFDGLHRFLPALVRRDGFAVGYVDVVDRPRRHGRSNYGLWDRLWVGILDLAGVWWLLRRRRRVPQVSEVT